MNVVFKFILWTLSWFILGYFAGYRDIERIHYRKRKDCQECALDFLEKKA